MKYPNQKPAKAGNATVVIIDGKEYQLACDADYTRAAEAIAKGGTIDFNGDAKNLAKLMDLAVKADAKFTRVQDGIAYMSNCSAKEAESLALYALNAGKTPAEAAAMLDNPTLGLKFGCLGQIFGSITELTAFLGYLDDAGKAAANGTIRAVVTEDGNPTAIEASLAPLMSTVPQSQQQATFSGQKATATLSLLTAADIAAAQNSGDKGLTVYAANIGGVTLIMSENMAQSLVRGQSDISGVGVVNQSAFQKGKLKSDPLSGKLVFRTGGNQQKKKP